MVLFPHQYNNLNKSYPFNKIKYPHVKGWLKTIEGNNFSTTLNVQGFLFQFPKVLDSTSKSFNKDTLKKYLSELRTRQPIELIPNYNTTYGQGKNFTRITSAIQAALAVDESKYADTLYGRVKEVFTDWMISDTNEVLHSKSSDAKGDTNAVGAYALFFYNKDWSTFYGFPSAYDTDTELNDHHFHHGYFLRTLVELMGKEGSALGQDSVFGGIAKMMIRDVAGDYRNLQGDGSFAIQDTLFPRFRYWDPYIGYSLASGHADFENGNNQESTSESMNFNTSVALYGAMIEDDYYRDLGLYLSATTLSAIENYWFDVKKQNFWNQPRWWKYKENNNNWADKLDSASYIWELGSVVWDNATEMATFFAASYEQITGIQFLPFTPSSIYLGRYPSWFVRLTRSIANNDLFKFNKQTKLPYDIWQNIWWSFLALNKPSLAVDAFNKFRNFTSDNLLNQQDISLGSYGENGNSRTYTYYWIHILNELGTLDTLRQAVGTPFYAVYANQSKGLITYIAFNPTSKEKVITFYPDSVQLTVGALQTAFVRKSISTILPFVFTNLNSDLLEVDFDTVEVGTDEQRYYLYHNNSEKVQIIDDIEIPDGNVHGFYIADLEEDKFILPGHTYIGIAGFKPLIAGLAQDPIIIVPDSAKTTQASYAVHLSGVAVNGSGIIKLSDNSKQKIEVLISPNPVQNKFSLKFLNSEFSDNLYHVEIWSYSGDLIYKNSVNKINNLIEINSESIPTGHYLIKLYNKESIFINKLIIIK